MKISNQKYLDSNDADKSKNGKKYNITVLTVNVRQFINQHIQGAIHG